MRNTPLRLAAAATALAFVSGCVSTTLVKSHPPGAKIYLDGEPSGTTPYPMTDQKIVGTATHVKLVLEGYEPYDAIIQRNEQFDAGACLGGVLVMFPFLWIMGYKPEHNYELTPLRTPVAPPPQAAPMAPPAQPAPAPAPFAAPRS